MDIEKLKGKVTIEIDGLYLFGLHGACCLAARHPKMPAEVRKLVIEFIKKAEDKLIEIGGLTEEEIKEIHRIERKFETFKKGS